MLSCWDRITAAPRGFQAWDAPSLLTAMAGRTTRIRLAVDVLNTSLRHPFLLASQLAVAQAASGGRLEVGLGAGAQHWAVFDPEAIGVRFPPIADRRRRLEQCCRVFPALWRGEEVTDKELGLRGASLGPVGIDPPPIVVGGQSERTLELAARYADGWNSPESDFERWLELSQLLDEVCRRVGRERPIAKTVPLFVRDIPLDEARDRLARFEEAGATSAVFVLHEERGADAVRRVAEAVFE